MRDKVATTVTPPDLPDSSRRHDTDSLVARIVDGDPAALVELHQTLGPQIHHIAAAHLHDLDEIRAVVAGTFVEVWRMARVHRLTPGSAADWICAIAIRRAADRPAAHASTLLRDIATVHDRTYHLEMHRHVGSALEAATPGL